MFCALLGQDIRRAFTGPLVLWLIIITRAQLFCHVNCFFKSASTSIPISLNLIDSHQLIILKEISINKVKILTYVKGLSFVEL